MKITYLVMIVALIFSLIFAGIFGFFKVFEGNELYEKQAYNQLIKVAESKTERVKDFLDNRKADAKFLASTQDVRNIFDEDLVKDVNIIEVIIKNIAKKTAGEIEEYIRLHPEMTVLDLQANEDFQKIAVQQVGETGWTFVADYENNISFFHHEPGFINFDITQFENIAPHIWGFYQIFLKERIFSGFFDDFNFEGIQIKKYISMVRTNVSAANSGKLMVAASADISEYGGSVQLASDLDKEFKEFQEKKGYSDLIFINPKGDVIWTAKHHNEIGTNLLTGIYNESLLANVFKDAKENLETGISDSKEYGTEGKLNLFVTSPVFEGGELIGIIALKLDNEKIEDLIATEVGLGEKGEVYFINRDLHYVTPLKWEEYEGRHEKGERIESERINACLNEHNRYDYSTLSGEDIDDVEKSGVYDNYAGNSVLGTYKHVLGSEWCVIVEIDEGEFSNTVPRINRVTGIIFGIDLFFLLVICLVLDKYFKIKKRKKHLRVYPKLRRKGVK